jgi:glycosyltransferase involved in cell wall biosynthesis
VDPLDSEAWAQAMRQVTTDPDLRQILVERGFEQVQRFSWRQTAQETLRILEEVGRALP